MPRLTTIALVIIIGLLSSQLAHAENMYSDNYQIIFGNFNITSGTKSSASYTLTDTVGQTAAGEFNSTGYTAKVGFQYIYTFYHFTFTISDLSIDFGNLISNTFYTDTNTLNISSPGAGGYAITAFENHPMQNPNSDQIPDTLCDSGPCSETQAEVWTNTTNTGFGYNISGDDVPADFIDSTYFRQFADDSSAESPAIVMSSVTPVKDNSATVTYKVNVDAGQASGYFENNIMYIATPAY